MKKKTGTVTFLGAGPGDPDLLTVRAVDALASADVVVVRRARHEAVLSHCRADAEVVDTAELDAGEAAKAAVAAAKEGRYVARVVDGDPTVTGGFAEEADACAKAKVPFELVPGVSPAYAVPGYAGVPVTSRQVRAVTVVSVDEDAELDWASVAALDGTVVFLGIEGSLGKVAAALVEHGRAGETPVAVTAQGTTTAQRTVVATLDTVEREVATLQGELVAVVGPTVRLRDRLSWWETKPLFGWKVLVPRTKEQAAALSDQLRGYGAVPVEVPTIAVEPPRTPQAMERAIKGLVSGRFGWVAFTSVNALKAVREKLEEFGLDARALAGIKVAAVGEQTAAALRGWGIEPDLVPSGEQSSEGLLAEWPDHDTVGDLLDRVLLPRADIATETLAAGLVERGWEVEDVTAYRTVRAAPPPAPIREAIKTGGFDAVLFTSSSTVRNLVGIAGKPHASTVIACIGPQTCKTVEEHGLRIDVMAPSPSVSALAEALADYGLQRRLADETEPPGKANRSKPRPPKKPK